MKKYVPYVVAAVCLVLFAVFFFRSCRDSASVAVARAELAAARKVAAENSKQAESERVALTSQIGQLNATVSGLKGELSRKDTVIGSFKSEAEKLAALYPTIQDKDSQIANLSEQVSMWKEAFTLSEAKCADYEGIIFALNQKYDAQVTIAATWRGQYEDMVSVDEASRKLISSLQRELRLSKSMGVLKSGIVFASAAVIVYGLVKK